MEVVLLTVYFLMWPVSVAAIMFVIARGFFKDWREARKKGEQII